MSISKPNAFANILEDSKILTQQSFRQAGKRKSGSLQRGFIQNAMLKTSVSSIPSKFETIIYKGNASKAFGTSSTRFHPGEFDKETPAPGYYYEEEAKSKNNQEQTSFSKKGYTTGFTSNQPRGSTFYSRYLNTGPGPGSYENQNQSKVSQSSAAWSTSNKGSAMFQNVGRKLQNNATKENDQETDKVEIPGPGHYNPAVTTYHGANPYHSAFNSRSNRNKYMQKSSTPDPGVYEIRKNILHPLGYKHEMNSANFCKAVEIKKEANQVKGLMKYLGEEKPIKGTPGPGTYFKEEEVEDEQQVDGFSKTEKNRFFRYLDINTKQNHFPGPAHYNTQQVTQLAKVGEERQLVAGAVFMSESIRKPFGDFDSKMGPNAGGPFVPMKKKSFHLNIAKKWV